jgi:hypothetical protein
MGSKFDHVRCDLAVVNGQIFFSELTFYSAAGYDWIDDSDMMKRLNDAWDIRKSWFLTSRQTGWRRLYAVCLKLALEKGFADAGDVRAFTRLAGV